MDKYYHLIVFGCQMNISDAERLSTTVEALGFKKTPDIAKADLIAIVMCSVRQSAVDRIHGLINKINNFKKNNRKLKTILTGCILKRDRKNLEEEFDYVIDIKELRNFSEIFKKKKPASTKNYLNIVPKYSSTFSANVPIMTGCNNFCSYCVVPYTREREISRPAKEIMNEISNLIENGFKEIWLLGQNVNSYTDKSENINFPQLLKLINELPGKFWIRFTSSHPKDFSDDLIEAMAKCNKMTPYLNLPVQSGDDKVLESMNRHYTVKDYKNKIKRLRKKVPNICLSTDIIVGFPGETKKQFENTAALFRNIKFDMAYINKYSPRAGTSAAKLKDDVPVAEKKGREKALNDILKKTALGKNKSFVGKEVNVLIDDNNSGSSEFYKKVIITNLPAGLLGKFVKVKITKAREWALEGEIINE